MEKMKQWRSLQGFISVLTLLTAASKASGCEKPSAPQCFRRHSEETVYSCEWTTSDTDRTFYIHFSDDKKFQTKNPTSINITEEKLFEDKIVDIWVEAHKGTSRCSSNKTRVKLVDSIKYETPHKVSVSWSQDDLSLRWRAPESSQALAEVWHRKDPTKTWHKLQRNTTVPKDEKYEINMKNLEKHSADQLQIRHRSTKAKNPLWSGWSNVLTVPIEFIRVSKKLLKGTRRVTLKWEAVRCVDKEAVSYQVDTQTFRGCPCRKWKHQYNTSRTTHVTFGSYSALNISVTSRNAAGLSPPAFFYVPPENSANLEMCNETVLEKKHKRVCSEWYELQDGAVKQDTVTILTFKNNTPTNREQIQRELKEFLPYIYFEHQCVNNKPQTVKRCLFYKKEGKPVSFPQDFITFGETHNSATLSWKPIPTVNQRGYVTHYGLCVVKVSSEDEQGECRNISASLKSYNLENLTPGSKYNITLVGVTRIGEGPKARVTINTLPEKPVNVWLSFGLLLIFFVISTLCTVVLTRIKNKIFPSVPTPVIPEFTAYQAELQDMLERKEEVHEVTLVQLHPECCPTEDVEKPKCQRGKRDDGSDVGEDNDEGDDISKTGSDDNEKTLKDSTEEELTDLDQVPNEIAMLIYRNGLVFDVNMDSS